jgi:hyaluronan synthase
MFQFLEIIASFFLNYSIDFFKYLFFFFFLFIFTRWGFYKIVSLFYKPYSQEFYPKINIGIPVAQEDPIDFEKSIRTIFYNLIKYPNSCEILVIINGKRDISLEIIIGKYQKMLKSINFYLKKHNLDFKKSINYVWTEKPGKRDALGLFFSLIEKNNSEIAILCDSDVVWNKSTLSELVKPFKDPKVGGVTSKQNVRDPERTFFTEFAEWLEEIRNKLVFKFLSVFGHIGCLPGRTIAFRKSILLKNKDEFLKEKFLGNRVEFSDDRSLTHYTLKEGYKTVYQETSSVLTDAPLKFSKYLKQQLRWGRGSQLNTIKQLPFLVTKPVLLFFFLIEMIIPFFVFGFLFSYIVNIFLIENSQELFTFLHYFLLMILGMYISFKIRYNHNLVDIRHILFLVFVMPFIRLYALASMADKTGWGTRDNLKHYNTSVLRDRFWEV